MKPTTTKLIYVVGDRHGQSLRTSLDAMQFSFREFSSGEDFFSSVSAVAHGCVLVDLELAGVRGLDFLRQLNKAGSTLPLIIVSDPLSPKLAVRAMHEGASTVLEHPVEVDDLYFAVRQALEENERRVADAKLRFELTSQFGSLSDGEKRVLEYAWLGHSNRTIAATLDISVRTIEARKKRLLEKTQSDSVAQMLIKYQMYEDLNADRATHLSRPEAV